MATIPEKEIDADKLARESSDQTSGQRPYYYFPPSQRKIHDSSVTFEEYHYFAQRTREEQKNYESPKLQWRQWLDSKKKDGIEHTPDDKYDSGYYAGYTVSDKEWSDASRAFRTAGWGAVFYLVGVRFLPSRYIEG